MPTLTDQPRHEETVVLGTRVSPLLLDAVRDVARLNERTLAAEIRVALRRHVLAVGGDPGQDGHDG